MEVLRKILVFLLSVLFLVLVVGGGFLYYQQGSFQGHNMQPETQNNQNNQEPNNNKPNNQPPRVPTPQEIAQVHAAFLNQYIDEINRAIGMVNQANSLITSDPFFANPPVIDQDSLKDTPFDTQGPLPAPDKKSIVVLPEGYLPYYQENMKNVHRGIYRLAQGMTLLNQILDNMNQDVSILRKNPNYLPPVNVIPQSPQGYVYPYPGYYPGVQPIMPNVMPNNQGTNMPTDHGAMTNNLFNGQTLTNGLYLFLILMFLMAFIAIGGFVLSLFRKSTQNQ